jgi:hypothetical protein
VAGKLQQSISGKYNPAPLKYYCTRSITKQIGVSIAILRKISSPQTPNKTLMAPRKQTIKANLKDVHSLIIITHHIAEEAVNLFLKVYLTFDGLTYETN